MSTVAEILEAVRHLPEAQKGEFLDRLRDIDFEDAWDRRIEADAKAGRLEPLRQQAVKDMEAGRAESIATAIRGS
jgi:hypothetical protein